MVHTSTGQSDQPEATPEGSRRQSCSDLDQRTERWLALFFGFLSGVLIGGAVGYTVGAGWL